MEDTYVVNLANHCFLVKQPVDQPKLENDGCVVCNERSALEQELQLRGMQADQIDALLLTIEDNGLYDGQGLIMPLVEDVEIVISNYFL